MSNPCRNNGVCQHKWYGSDYAYTCQCPSQTFGTHCENVDSVNQCTSVECCPQGGSCMDLFNEAICTCHTGYTGTSCSSQNTLGVAMPVTGCAAGSAGNHDYSTPPPPPYTTPTAGMQCTTYSCQNAGECRSVSLFGQNTGESHCVCAAGWSGDSCQCSTQSLGTVHGQCTASGMSATQCQWSCVCSPGYISSGSTPGRFCDVPTNHPSQGATGCLPNPCQHGGQCSSYSVMGTPAVS